MTTPSPQCSLGRIGIARNRQALVVRLKDDAHGLRMAVVPAAGAEIADVRCRTRGRWRELLYRALDYRTTPPDGWDGRAPLLWPAVGRSFTHEQIARRRRTGRKPRSCRVTLAGRERAFPIHGFARRRAWVLDSYGNDAASAWVKCSLRSSRDTRKAYPFDFDLRVTHRLAGGKIVSQYEMTAGANDGPMPFAIGNHVSFRIPLGGRGKYQDCTVRTPARRKYDLTDIGLLSGRSRRISLERPAQLTKPIYADTFLGGYTSRNAWVELCDPASVTVRISQAEKPVAGKRLAHQQDYHFVFWGNPGCGYFCPEPWIGAPNALNTGRNLVALPAARTFKWEMRIAVKKSRTID